MKEEDEEWNKQETAYKQFQTNLENQRVLLEAMDEKIKDREMKVGSLKNKLNANKSQM